HQLSLAAHDGLHAFEGDAVGHGQRLDVLALRSDRRLDVEERRLAVNEELAELAGGLVEIRVKPGEIGGLQGLRIEERAAFGHAVGLPLGLGLVENAVRCMLHCTTVITIWADAAPASSIFLHRSNFWLIFLPAPF